MGQLDGKSTIVTGASRGIGAEIARLLAAEGARVMLRHILAITLGRMCRSITRVPPAPMARAARA